MTGRRRVIWIKVRLLPCLLCNLLTILLAEFDHFIQDTPVLTDEFICRRGDNYPLPDAPPPRMSKWVLKLPSADAWATPAPINPPTPPPLPPSSRVASPSPAPETNIKRDPYEEEDELMQQVKVEMEDSPVKFEDQPEFKEEDSDPWMKIKRDPYQEEDEQMDGLRDLERGHDLEEQPHAERWQPYETPLLPGTRQRDEEPIRVKQESEDPRRKLVLNPICHGLMETFIALHDESASRRGIKQEEQSRRMSSRHFRHCHAYKLDSIALYNEEDGRRVLADLLRTQREDEITGRRGIKQEEQSRRMSSCPFRHCHAYNLDYKALYNEEDGRRVLADLLRIQREEREQREVQSSQALPRVKLERTFPMLLLL